MATLKLLVNEVEYLKETLSRSQQTLSRSIQRTCASHSAGLHTPRVESLGSPRKTFHLVNEVSATAHNPKDDFLRAENDYQKQQILHQQGLIATLTLAVESQAAAIHKMSKLDAAGPVVELPKVDAATTGAATAVSLANAITCLSSCDMLGADTYRMLSSKTCGVHDAELKTQVTVVGLALEEAVAASDSAAAVATLQQQQTATLQQDVLAALAEMGRVDEGASSAKNEPKETFSGPGIQTSRKGANTIEKKTDKKNEMHDQLPYRKKWEVEASGKSSNTASSPPGYAGSGEKERKNGFLGVQLPNIENPLSEMDRNARRIGIGFLEAFNPETQKLAKKEAEAKAKDEASAVRKANRERIQAERRKQEETENTKPFGKESLMESPPLYSV